MKKIFFYIIIISGIFSSCTDDESTTDIAQNVIIEGFLHANQPITDLKLMNVISYYDTLTTDNRITDANVTIEVDGNAYAMTSVGDGTYELPNHTVTSEKTYKISLDYYGQTIEAETTIPTALSGVSLSDSIITLERINFSSGPPTPSNFNQPPLEIAWNDDGTSYYFVHIENTSDEIDWVNSNRIPEEEALFSFTSTPEITDLYTIDSRQLVQFGTYRVVVYKVNLEYAQMLSEQSNDSFSLTEPFTNVTNGRGIFTGMSSDTIYFEVEPL